MESKGYKTTRARIKKDKRAMLEALREVPVIHHACKKVGIGRATYYRWLKEDDIFRKQAESAEQEGIEFINDIAESSLLTLIKEKKLPAIALWLKHHSARYQIQKQGSPAPEGRSFTQAPEMNPEVKEAMEAAHKAGIIEYERVRREQIRKQREEMRWTDSLPKSE